MIVDLVIKESQRMKKLLTSDAKTTMLPEAL